MMARWLPNTNEIFYSLGRLLESCEEQNISRDSIEFLVRRLDEYARTLSILISRFSESYGHLSSQQPCLRNLYFLFVQTSSYLAQFQRDISLQEDTENNFDFPDLGPGPAVEMNNNAGRPRIFVTREQLETLHEQCHLHWSDIAHSLGISERTIRRRRHEFGMPVEGRQFSIITDSQLDQFVARILQDTPAVGLRMIMGSLRHRGLTIQRHRVLHSIRRVDPVTSSLRNSRRIIRRSYNVNCPNALWYILFIFYLFEIYLFYIMAVKGLNKQEKPQGCIFGGCTP